MPASAAVHFNELEPVDTEAHGASAQDPRQWLSPSPTASPRARSAAQAHHHLKGHEQAVALPQQEQPIVELSKVDYARMTVEADNYAWSKAHRAASADRAAWQERTRKRLAEMRATAAAAGREAVRSGMMRSLEENRQQNATLVSQQRERMREIAQQRDNLRKQHAAHGKELHESKYGNAAASQRTLLQSERGEQRKRLGQKMAELEAERVHEQAAGAAQRSASADRIRSQSGSHVLRGVLSQELERRSAEVRAKRAQSHQWEETTRRQRTLSSSPKMSTISFTNRERQKAEVDALKQKVPDFAELRSHLHAHVERKRTDAAAVRGANASVNHTAKEVLNAEAQGRKAVHDHVKVNKIVSAPLPIVADGGVAGSRKASSAAAIAQRSTLGSSSKRNPMPSSGDRALQLDVGLQRLPIATTGLRFRTSAYIFEPGPTGLKLEETAAGVVVESIAPGSSAAAVDVPLGGVLLAVNAMPLSGLGKSAVEKALSKANWPMTLQIAPCLEYVFEENVVVVKKKKTVLPIGLTVGDTQNGVIVKDVAKESPAENVGVPIGGLLVTANGMPTAGMMKDEVGLILKERPIRLQIVPRDAAYLYRPRGVFRRPSSPRAG